MWPINLTLNILYIPTALLFYHGVTGGGQNNSNFSLREPTHPKNATLWQTSDQSEPPTVENSSTCKHNSTLAFFSHLYLNQATKK